MRTWFSVGVSVALVAAAVYAGLRLLSPSALPGHGAHVDGPLLVSAAPGASEAGMDAIVQGELTYDGRCLLLGGHPVVWPHGTEWDPDGETVRLPEGERAAVGDTVAGGGGYVDKRYFRDGEDVYGMYGEQGEQLVTDCAGPTGQVAFFNEGAEVGLVD